MVTSPPLSLIVTFVPATKSNDSFVAKVFPPAVTVLTESFISSTTKSIVLSDDWYVAEILVSVLEVNIAPTSAFISASVLKDTVPLASGNVIVLSAVGSVIVNLVSWSSAVAPSKTIASWALIVWVFTVVVVPLTSKFPLMTTDVSSPESPIVNVSSPV